MGDNNSKEATATKTVVPPREPTVVWEDLLMQVETASLDVKKNMEKHNLSAGVRLRKSVRKVRALCLELVKATMLADEAVKQSRATKKETAKKE